VSLQGTGRLPGPQAGAVPRRRSTERARLGALVVVVSAIALLVIDVLLPTFLHSSLITDRDRTLQAVVRAVPAGAEVTVQSLSETLADNPPLRGEIGWTLVTPQGIATVKVHLAQDGNSNPAVGSNPPTGEPITVGDANGGDAQYRILALQLVTPNGFPAGYAVAWSPLDDINGTIKRLVFVELMGTAGLLVLLGALAGWVVRRTLKPLETMAAAADEIRAGNLERRVEEQDPATEIGRLGSAFNGMLDGIGTLLSEQTRNEERLRRFIADASHELRTPVAAVQGYSELYKAGALTDPAAVGRAMERMGFEARRMGALVEDLLTLAKTDSDDPAVREPVELIDLLSGVVEDARAIDAERGWRLAGDPAPVTVVGDRMRLHQVFANLLGNVRTHTPAGTTAVVSVLPGPDKIAVTVSDDGPGVTDADLNRIFDRFFRADPSRSREKGGTGLGLSIVQAIVRAHGGEVLAARSAGGGLAITVVLPRASGTKAVRQSDPSADRPPAGAVVTGPIPVVGSGTSLS
jgi:two-component system, OmpR family, sensor kinase